MPKPDVTSQALRPLGSTPDWRRRAAKLLARGDRKGAAKAFQRYLAAPVTQPLLRGAQAWMVRGDFASAELMLGQHLDRDTDDPAALHLLGQVTLTIGKFDTAEQALRRAVENRARIHRGPLSSRLGVPVAGEVRSSAD